MAINRLMKRMIRRRVLIPRVGNNLPLTEKRNEQGGDDRTKGASIDQIATRPSNTLQLPHRAARCY